ncbi:hypothetical protein SDC9_113842 [bioreactor metagenome]|uniref:Uncharacterized protein n=1 Tax=bioreactor metagenome TaxID=1076179 RepID=A0A645BP81_9ZZZZ
MDVVPRVVISGGNGENSTSNSNVMEGLLTLLLSDKLNLSVDDKNVKVKNKDTEKLREEIRKALAEKKTPPADASAPAAETPKA